MVFNRPRSVVGLTTVLFEQPKVNYCPVVACAPDGRVFLAKDRMDHYKFELEDKLQDLSVDDKHIEF